MPVLPANIWPRRPTPAATEQTRAAGLALRRPVPPLVNGAGQAGARVLLARVPRLLLALCLGNRGRGTCVDALAAHTARAALSILSQEESEEVLAAVKPECSSRALAAGCCRAVDYRR